MVENARFFAQKRTFLHIFAGGRGDFLAGQKWGFFGSGRSRERAGARHFLCHVSRDTKRPTGVLSGPKKIYNDFSVEVFFERIVPRTSLIVCS
jgi:hypothetical protein